MRDLSSPTRDRTGDPCCPAVEVQSPNPWTTREFPTSVSFKVKIKASSPLLLPRLHSAFMS